MVQKEPEDQMGEVPCPWPHRSYCVSQQHTGQALLPGPFSPTLCSSFCPVQLHPLALCLTGLSLYFDDIQPLHICLSQGPRHRHPCAVPRALSAWEMRPWQVRSGGDSAPGFLSGEALSHSVRGTPQGSDSDSAGQAPWGHPVPIAKVRYRVPEYEPPSSSSGPSPFGEEIHSC